MPSNVLISTHFITKSYGVQPLFSDISLQVLDNERLGLIGPNGAGKSTLLKILANIEPVDSGEISLKKNTHIIYLPQEDVLDPKKTIAETLRQAVPEGLEPWQVNKRHQEIMGLIEVDNPDGKVDTLSGGWRKRLAIGQALFQHPDLLLMDEPTNHLDLEGILWLENLLIKAPFAFVLVSHDRFFLENTTNRIVELDRRYPQGFIKVKGNYSAFVEKREKYLQEQAKLETVLSNKVRREIEWLRRGPKARATKAKFRIDKAYQLQEDLETVKGRNVQNRGVDIAFDTTGRKTKILLEAQRLAITLGGKRLFANLSLKLTPGMTLGVMGRNGTGKSTLIQILNGQRAPETGSLKVADGLQIVTFDQKRELPGAANQTLRQVLSPEGDTVIFQARPIHVTAWAKRFLFQVEQLGMPVSGLSGGEKARVLIANLMRQPADILLLDEPTNDLDIPTLQVLEESLEEFAGAIVLITHDRFLMARLCDQLLYLDGDGGVQFFADYDQWLEQRKTVNASAPSGETAKNAPNKKPQTLAREERKEIGRIEKQLEKAEGIADDLQRQLHDPEIQCDAVRLAEIYSKHQEAQMRVEQLYQRWEELEAGSRIDK